MAKEKLYEMEETLIDVRCGLTSLGYDVRDLRLARSHVFEAIDALKFLEEDPSDSYYHEKVLKHCRLGHECLVKNINENNYYETILTDLEEMDQMILGVIEEVENI